MFVFYCYRCTIHGIVLYCTVQVYNNVYIAVWIYTMQRCISLFTSLPLLKWVKKIFSDNLCISILLKMFGCLFCVFVFVCVCVVVVVLKTEWTSRMHFQYRTSSYSFPLFYVVLSIAHQWTSLLRPTSMTCVIISQTSLHIKPTIARVWIGSLAII